MNNSNTSILRGQHTYSLWLRPSQTQIDEFTKIISALSHRFNTTPFPPHITLLSSIYTEMSTLTRLCENIINKHCAFNITLEQIAYTNDYFRNLYILARLEPPLVNIHEEAKKQLDYKTDETYTPHVSLFYGKLIEKKQQALKQELDKRYPKVFNCNRLDLYCTSGKESEWHLIDSFNLK